MIQEAPSKDGFKKKNCKDVLYIKMEKKIKKKKHDFLKTFQ